jgi:serine/threonine protein kinase
MQELATFNSMRKDAALKMMTIAESCKILEKLSEQAKVCRAQCSNLVRIFVQGITKTKETYFDPLIENNTSMWLLYNSWKLTQLLSSLDQLSSTIWRARDLVQDCDKKWDGMVLILSIPMAPPEKNAHHSKFDFLIDELSWNLDKIQFILLHLSGGVELKWNETLCRYALEGKNSAAEVPAAQGMQPAESARLVLQDRDDFSLQLQNGSLSSLEVADIGESSWLPKLWCCLCISEDEDAGVSGMSEEEEKAAFLESVKQRSESITQSREKVATVVQRRLQEASHLSIKCNSVPECFWMDHKELKLTKRLSGGGDKSIYKGNWLGQEVAIGTMEGVGDIKETTGREALIMLKVQHPNIVDFFGCAFTDEAYVKRDGLEEKCTRGYLVMECMPKDLRNLRRRLAKQHGIPPVVLIDILLQIVEAMIQMHNRGIMHRDLKAANCLVKERPNSPECSSQAPVFYTVKLIDFGSSEFFDDTADSKHFANQGSRRWMAPEVWGPPGPGRAEYTKKADVFSFGMTCYEVITGWMPLHEHADYELPAVLKKGKRPDSFPPYVRCPEDLKLLMGQCWAQEPSDRPSFETIRKDLWTIKYDLEIW